MLFLIALSRCWLHRVWVVLDDRGCMLNAKLVVGAMHELVLVRVAFDCALTVAVMHWQAVHSVVALWPIATLFGMTGIKVNIVLAIVVVIFFWVHPVIWLPASHGVVPVPVN